MARKKQSKSLPPQIDPNAAIEYFNGLIKKYSELGRPAEEALKDFNAWVSSLPVASKSQIRAQKKLQKLNEYIELANMLPPDIPLPDIGILARSIDPSLVEGTMKFGISQFRILLRFLGGDKIPPAFREYVLEVVPETVRSFEFDPEDEEFVRLRSGIYFALRRFAEWGEVRSKLRAIAHAAAASEKPWNVTSCSDIIIDSNGVLQRNGDAFAETILGLEAARIRECQVCKRIFWANPKSKMSCSPRCRNVFNVRKHRALIKTNRTR